MRVFFIVLGLSGVVCAARRQSRIVGGEDARIEDYPFMTGMLGKSYEGTFYLGCGATLISTTSVVSAAHWFEGVPAPSIRVRFGTIYDKHGGVVHIVSRIIMHPQYDPDTLLNDIRVMRLRDPVVYTDQIKSARIAGPRYHLPAGTVVYAAGWGDIQYGGPHSEILQHVAVNVIDHQICIDRYENPIRQRDDISDLHYLTPEMLCTGILDVGGKDACTGDSGGPVVHNGDVLVGITSWGHECAHPYYPGVNTRVSSFANWIYENSIN